MAFPLTIDFYNFGDRFLERVKTECRLQIYKSQPFTLYPVYNIRHSMYKIMIFNTVLYI